MTKNGQFKKITILKYQFKKKLFSLQLEWYQQALVKVAMSISNDKIANNLLQQFFMVGQSLTFLSTTSFAQTVCL